MIKRKQEDNNKEKRYVNKKTAAGKAAIPPNPQGKTGGRALYVLGSAGLVLLLLFSFYVPQLIFNLRDSYLCRDIVHVEQENADVTLMVATYEPSLEKRLKNFIEGQEKGRIFYVSAHEMEVTEDMYQQLRGTDGILYQQAVLRAIMEIGAVSYIFLMNDTFTINCWKQYVIYSDEYTEGVNFIIWYLDLMADDGKRLELLIDAEDAALYALYAEQNISLTMTQAFDADISDVLGTHNLEELWYFLNYYYQSISREEWYNEVIYYSKNGQLQSGMDRAPDGTVTLEMIESAWADGDAISFPNAQTLIMHLLLFRNNFDFSFRIFRDQRRNNSSNPYLYPELYIGIDSISELIPEFAERF